MDRAMTNPVPSDLLYLQWLITECGYLHPKLIQGGRWAAVCPKMFTHAIIAGRMFDTVRIDEHWCYSTRGEAERALAEWSGDGEPDGWFRHPASGRRVNQGEFAMHRNGLAVARGEIYVRP
jgi:hypothetical protein